MPKSEQNRIKLVPLPRTAASYTPGSLTRSTKTVSLAAATVHDYSNCEKNRKGLEINQKHICIPEKSVNIKFGTSKASEKYKNKKCVETASHQISECQKDHLAFQAFLRIGSTVNFTHAAIQQPGMGSRKYEKATTLPTNVSTSQKYDKEHQISTKASLGISPQVPSSTSTVVGSSFWSRTAGVGKFGSHPASSFQDFDNSVSDAWDIKDVKGINYGGSAGHGIVIDVQPTSVSPFSIAKTNSIGPGVHGKRSANANLPTTAKTSGSLTYPEMSEKLEKTRLSNKEENIEQPKAQNQESIPSLTVSDTIKGSTAPQSTKDSYVSNNSPTHISTTVPSSISTPTSTTISLGLNSKSNSGGITTKFEKDPEVLSGENKRYAKLENLINDCQSFEIEELRKLAWSGISSRARAKAWKILCGYLPPPGTASISPEENLNNSASTLSAKQPQPTSIRRRNQEEVVQRKQAEYMRYVEQYFTTRHDDDGNGDTYRQIHIDIPRMSPVVGLFQQRCVQEIFERILYIWAIRHPASGYVQGINDLVTPFFLVFLHDSLRATSENPGPFEALFTAGINNLDVESSLPKEHRDYVEADAYWCLTKVLDGIQDNYTFAQPGIQLKVKQLEDLTRRIDQELHEHLVGHDVEYIQFAFRWMNNLLMRELPVRATVRLWDTYLAQADGFSHFHLYVCAAFLCHWKSDLMKKKDFHTLLMFLQNVPTAKWGDNEINLLVAEAYRLSYLFAGAPSHLSGSKVGKS